MNLTCFLTDMPPTQKLLIQLCGDVHGHSTHKYNLSAITWSHHEIQDEGSYESSTGSSYLEERTDIKHYNKQQWNIWPLNATIYMSESGSAFAGHAPPQTSNCEHQFFMYKLIKSTQTTYFHNWISCFTHQYITLLKYDGLWMFQVVLKPCAGPSRHELVSMSGIKGVWAEGTHSVMFPNGMPYSLGQKQHLPAPVKLVMVCCWHLNILGDHCEFCLF